MPRSAARGSPDGGSFKGGEFLNVVWFATVGLADVWGPGAGGQGHHLDWGSRRDAGANEAGSTASEALHTDEFSTSATSYSEADSVSETSLFRSRRLNSSSLGEQSSLRHSGLERSGPPSRDNLQNVQRPVAIESCARLLFASPDLSAHVNLGLLEQPVEPMAFEMEDQHARLHRALQCVETNGGEGCCVVFLDDRRGDGWRVLG
eukprot:CAMPEP_0196666986 /NCGR_PEP_ID=MMETSP1086-20130531/64826_1 /TAXON_ID=77921 /ORGANISM="Cyanoptyche  gloeocystis , Strain SAG4.97" /LENGTH=204 /DNA_ID=CAMNT_0042004253 /DNA_START=1392 /DNA_END=2008 /DNA_ORIENTATION=+